MRALSEDGGEHWTAFNREQESLGLGTNISPLDLIKKPSSCHCSLSQYVMQLLVPTEPAVG